MTSDRSFPPRPIVGVGAVVIDADRVLLVRRAKPPLEGHWSLPGGAVEVGETLSSAIQREVFEETGMANMEALVDRFGPAPRAFLVVPMVGAFFIDFINAVLITVCLNLWS